MSDLYFDPSQFDFTKLVDVIEQDAEPERPYTKAADINQDGGVIDDASDLDSPGSYFDSKEDEQEESTDFNDNVNDLIDSEKVNSDAVSIFNDLDDSTPLDFGDGFEMTKPQVKELLRSKQLVDQQKEFLDIASQKIDQGNEWIESQLLTKQTAIDKNIAFLEKCLTNPTITGDDYRKFHNDLQTAKQAKSEIEADAQHILNVRKEQEEALTRHRFIITDTKMQEVYPDWLKWKDQLVNDAVSRGMSPQTIMKSWDQSFATTLLESFMYRKNKEKAGVKARQAADKIKAARSTQSAAAVNRAAAADRKEAEKRALLAKQRKGGLTRDENAKMFDYLVD
ncbi:hypothetical protein INE66_003646 [Salmonella enterica subsp. enterica]|nr:hypothetical protein [Salmonella enterica subsp. enterica]